jgi:hypothetical protein
MAHDDDFDAVVKLIVKHDKLISLLARGVADHACFIAPLITRCCKEGFDQPATVEHRELAYKMCDHCAAETVCKSGRNFTADLNDAVNLARGLLMQEDLWIDMPDADKIRRLVEYIDAIRDTVDAKAVESH